MTGQLGRRSEKTFADDKTPRPVRFYIFMEGYVLRGQGFASVRKSVTNGQSQYWRGLEGKVRKFVYTH